MSLTSPSVLGLKHTLSQYFHPSLHPLPPLLPLPHSSISLISYFPLFHPTFIHLLHFSDCPTPSYLSSILSFIPPLHSFHPFLFFIPLAVPLLHLFFSTLLLYSSDHPFYPPLSMLISSTISLCIPPSSLRFHLFLFFIPLSLPLLHPSLLLLYILTLSSTLSLCSTPLFYYSVPLFYYSVPLFHSSVSHPALQSSVPNQSPALAFFTR